MRRPGRENALRAENLLLEALELAGDEETAYHLREALQLLHHSD